jgi:hypothetical protein
VDEAFRGAFSKGAFFADHIRPVFRYRKVSDPSYERRPSPP